ncbi:hypothetical protein F2Q68_00033023 [Brassica cretica]|uniref:Uncharacterized protein n=1 Tax=Brassica cretica TaxID=69181 RepID=A0A8S9GC22_BRACR|nr:hypothetical protein F2Q68_00033023 [Brassica cretica]
MWQVVLGAAIAAGSTGLVAKRFFNPFSPHPRLLPEDRSEEEQEHVTTPVGIGFLGSPCEKTNGVFRFSSSGSAGSGSGSSPGFRKSPGVSCKVKVRGLMKQKKNKNNGGGSEIEKRSGNVSLKKPRTLGADSASKRDHSTFSSALGVCMMYMMSAEKNEISKLHTATEETVKAIQELKDELSRIKSLQGFKSSGKSDLTTKPEIASGEESVDTKSGKDGEYASSVLTEEPEHEAVEMEQLEMELESELQKLNLAETSELMEECKELVNGSESYQYGISASELDKKLSRLLIEQQEGQINELESLAKSGANFFRLKFVPPNRKFALFSICKERERTWRRRRRRRIGVEKKTLQMWQVVLGAAIAAGSTGLVAKRFFNPFSPHPPFPEDHSEEEQEHVTTPVGIGFLGSPCEKTNGVFRFSSSGSAGSGSGSSPGFRKSPGVTCKVKVRGLMKQKKNKRKNNGGGSEIEKRSGTVCLKKARTLSADSASKRGSGTCSNNNQDHSTFSSALGVCMMYMMSAEKNEISKLHTATEETVKAIQELKDELSRIKSLQGFKSSGKSDLTTKPEIASGEESVDTKSGKDGEYASSVLTEEPEHEAVEMEQLEMELESELQKLNLAEVSVCFYWCNG